MKRVVARKDAAVSPIIGTVLLIAITVTLAASLYTVLGGYFNSLPQPSPTASLKVVNGTTESAGSVNGNYTIFVTYISNNISTDHVQMIIIMNNSAEYTFMLSSVEAAPGSVYAIGSGGTGSLTATYSGTPGFLTSSSSVSLHLSGSSYFVSRISLIDKSVDASMGSVTLVS